MTNYGAIPTSSHPALTSANLEYISRAKQRLKSGFAARRPWKLMFDLHSFGLPHGGFFATISRMKTNLAYFRMNYAIIVLIILFLSLLYHPTSLIVFVALMAIWLFLYFLRDEPLSVIGRQVDDRTVLICLSVLTVVLLLLTHATMNIVGALVIGAVVIVVHSVVRRTEDLFMDEEEARGEASGLTSYPSS
ncbi:PREDICTED: PRA1 family protein F3-like [Tarenaya hassleriana]|uniref:PRA1 family protein F3-like n=1 Tax=Tarenaya hassleriana TaxID=28532 RepID=UPI00053C464E|nr:PREDICTED: PRA1 family protein F3-like [Tarenaya hassleriana]